MLTDNLLILIDKIAKGIVGELDESSIQCDPRHLEQLIDESIKEFKSVIISHQLETSKELSIQIADESTTEELMISLIKQGYYVGLSQDRKFILARKGFYYLRLEE